MYIYISLLPGLSCLRSCHSPYITSFHARSCTLNSRALILRRRYFPPLSSREMHRRHMSRTPDSPAIYVSTHCRTLASAALSQSVFSLMLTEEAWNRMEIVRLSVWQNPPYSVEGAYFFFFFVVVLLCCPTMGWSLLSALNSCFPVSNETSGDQDTHWSCTRLSNLCFRTIDAGHLFPFFAF